MANADPLASLVPRLAYPPSDGESTVTKPVEKIEGEVALDTYVKAQTSMPEVVKRITDLENCVWRLAEAVLTSINVRRRSELRAIAEEVKLLLK
jgi:hypothetical protein